MPFITITVINLIIWLFFNNFRKKLIIKFNNICGHIEEKINVLNKSIEVKNKLLAELPIRNDKISILFNVSPKLINIIEPQEVIEFLIRISNDLFLQADNILFFSLDNEANKLRLMRSFATHSSLIKEEEGDLLDKWVLKYNTSLLVEDVNNDYRFDSNKTIAFKERNVTSFILSPLSLGDKLIAILRVESKKSLSFNLEDLRILRAISDLGAVVLERANLFKQVEELAIKDSLTNLYVRSYFLQRFKEECLRAQMKNSKLGIIMLDIDDFKRVNDNYGHVVGDLVLKTLADKLREFTNKSGDLVARFGGEEFVFLFVEALDLDRLKSLAQDIRKSVEKIKIKFRDKSISFTVSLGVVIYPQDGQDYEKIIDKVDQRLYKAKRAGKNKVCIG